MCSSHNRTDSGPPGQPVHVPVLLKEVLHFLHLEPGLTVVDGTVGAAGHSREIVRRIAPTGLLIGLDRWRRPPQRRKGRIESRGSREGRARRRLRCFYVGGGSFFAARSRAERDRGLKRCSAGEAVIGFGLRSCHEFDSRNACLTSRSSSEWKLMMTTIPPGLRQA